MEEEWLSLALLFMADDSDLPITPLPLEDDKCDKDNASRTGKSTKKKRSKRKWWVKPWIQKREAADNQYTMFTLPTELIAMDDTAEFRALLRMDSKRFYMLLEILRPRITYKSTQMRRPIGAEERLIITLRFLATGATGVALSHQFRVGRSTIFKIIRHTCQMIYAAMKDEYLTTPTNLAAWQGTSQLFWEKWNFPNCIGALDGKHVSIYPPAGSGSKFYNYKGHFSIIMLALVDANYEFLYLDVGAEGRAGDAGVWNQSVLQSAMQDGTLEMPGLVSLPGGAGTTPHVIVADDAFSLTPSLMKPFSRRNLTIRQRIFNYRLSRARRVSENAFGILANRFRALLQPLNQSAASATDTVLASCTLHNFLRREIGEGYLCLSNDGHEAVIANALSSEGLHNLELSQSRNPGREAKVIRESLADFFMSEAGSVSWQMASVGY